MSNKPVTKINPDIDCIGLTMLDDVIDGREVRLINMNYDSVMTSALMSAKESLLRSTRRRSNKKHCYNAKNNHHHH